MTPHAKPAPVDEAALRREQRGVAVSILIGLATAAASAAAVWISPLDLPAMSLAERMTIGVKCALVPSLWLLFMVARVSTIRFFSAADMRGSAFAPPSARLAVDAAVLQNSVEQALIAVPVYLALAAQLDGRSLLLVPLLSALFLIGRIAFWWGYPHGAAARSLGMSMTLYPTLVAALGAAALSLGASATS